MKKFVIDSALLLVFLLLGAWISVRLGQDINFDLLNYHYHNAWAILNGRQAIDFFTAGIHGYFDPALDLPYYWLANGPLRYAPVVLAAALGIPYGATLFVIFLLSRCLATEYFAASRFMQWLIIAVCLILAGSGAAMRMQVGTTFNEVQVAFLVLLAVLVFVKSHGHDGFEWKKPWGGLVMGALLGCAAGLKLTAAVYVPALGIAIIFAAQSNRNRLRVGLWFGLGVIAAFALTYGPWAVHLYRETGNPFFPMFNNVFHSPWWGDTSARDTHFLPKNARQWLFYPFYWAVQPSMLTSEMRFRDPRLALFLVATVIVLLVSAIRGLWGSTRAKPRSTGLINGLIVFTVAAYLLWLGMFSIYRYAIPVEVMAAILIPVLAVRAIRQWSNKIGVAVETGVCVVLALALALAILRTTIVPTSWGRVPYSKSVFVMSKTNLPRDALVVIVQAPLSFIAPLLTEENPTLRFAGVLEYADNTLPAERASDIIKANIDNAYIAYYARSKPTFPWLRRIGVGLDFDDCLTISTNISPDIALCKARAIAPESSGPDRFRLDAHIEAKPGVALTVQWTANDCTASTQRPGAHFYWKVEQPDVARTDYFVQSPTAAPALVAAGDRQGDVMIDDWLTAGQIFTLRSANGAELATAHMRYVPCD